MAYGTLQGWREYAAVRGDDTPTAADDATANAALERATDYIRLHYVPRMGDVDPADERIVEATYIAAGLELVTPRILSRHYDPTEAGKILTAVGDIEWTVLPGAMAGHVQISVPAIEALLGAASRRHLGVGFTSLGVRA